MELLEDGWLAVTLEAVLPRRGDGDRGRFLAHSLRAAIRRAFPDRLPPKFHICVLASTARAAAFWTTTTWN